MPEQIITLKNDCLSVKISTLGAEMQSVVKDGVEYLWNGNPDVWKGRAPVLFPICGSLKNDRYEFLGKEYSMGKHGYARTSHFDVEILDEDTAVFLLKSDEKSKQVFPFDYEFRISYTIYDSSISVGYSVINKSSGDMYFSIGAHEGYMCPEGIEEYSLAFDKEETLETCVLNGPLLTNDFDMLAENTFELPLVYDFFEKYDTLTFMNLKSRAVTLKQNNGERTVRVEFDGFDNLFVWTRKGAKYICIEPWCGVPDVDGSSYDFTKKKGINKIGEDESFERTHTITFE